MPSSYVYRANAQWTSGRRGVVQAAEQQAKSIVFSAPPEFQGESGFWSPEDFLVAAVASCFVTTFRAIAEFSKFEPASLEISVEGIVEKGDGGYQFTQLLLKPYLTIHRESDRERAARLLEKTERSCLIARSLKSKITVDAKIQIAEPVSTVPEIHLVGSKN
jgi:peroxiredoxin-like protein